MFWSIGKKWDIFWNIPFQQKQLFFVSFLLCGLAKTAICLLSFRRLRVYFGHSCGMGVASTLVTAEQESQARKIRQAIALAAKYTPWNSNCLVRAMVAKFWCQHFNIPYMMFIGLAKKTDKPLGEDGHAWVTAGRIAITGSHCLNSHQVISSFSNLQFKK